MRKVSVDNIFGRHFLEQVADAREIRQYIFHHRDCVVVRPGKRAYEYSARRHALVIRRKHAKRHRRRLLFGHREIIRKIVCDFPVDNRASSRIRFFQSKVFYDADIAVFADAAAHVEFPFSIQRKFDRGVFDVAPDLRAVIGQHDDSSKRAAAVNRNRQFLFVVFKFRPHIRADDKRPAERSRRGTGKRVNFYRFVDKFLCGNHADENRLVEQHKSFYNVHYFFATTISLLQRSVNFLNFSLKNR